MEGIEGRTSLSGRGRFRNLRLLFGVSIAAVALLVASYPSNAALLGSGRFHNLWIKDDSTLASWGYNVSGQLGDGTYLDRAFPVTATGLSGVQAAAGGQWHSLALRNDGRVWAWGNNSYGQLGTGNLTWQVLPIQVPNLTNVIGIASGDYHSLAAKTDGTVWAWGSNDNGELGDGTQTSRNAPVRVAALIGINAVAAGAKHSVALRSDGTVWTWGDNTYGQLGDATVSARLTPVQVSGLTGVVAISALNHHTLALKSDGTVWAWGNNGDGQLADGSTTSRTIPVRSAGLTGIVRVVAGGFSSYAIRGDGAVLAWGSNFRGQLGDGTAVQQRSAPIQVVGVGAAIGVAAGVSHAAFLRSDGSVWTTGQNIVGQLGDASILHAPAPVQSTGLTGVSALAGGSRHSLAVRSDGTVVGLGDNSYFQLGDGTQTSRGQPTPVAGLTNVVMVAAGGYHSIALRGDGTVWAWGSNDSGELGDSTFSSRSTPIQVLGLSSVTAIAAGYAHSIAVKADGSVWAWGSNTYGQVGDGTKTNRNIPTRVSGLSNPARIAAGGYHSVALRADGTVLAWGQNDYGQLGNGSNTESLTPVQVLGLTGIVGISGGRFHTVALKSGGTVWAWGSNSSGKLGIGSYEYRNSPTQVFGAEGATFVVANGFNSFALRADGTVLAWGGGGFTGDGTDRDLLVPTALQFIGPVDQLAVGLNFALARTRTGTVMGWGSNYSQKLGIPFPVQVSTPVKLRDPLVPYAGSDLVVEFFNPTIRNAAGNQGIGHHFITAAAAEQVSIDNGGSGPGWVRTGRTFRAWNDPSKAPAGAVPVYRFYARGPNSHFYTAGFAEYQSLRNQNPTNNPALDWAYEDIVFHTILPSPTGCPNGYYPIYRSYNNRFAANDSNHRITPSVIDWVRSIYFLGYADEGVAFCSPASPDPSADLHAWYYYPGLEIQSGAKFTVVFIFANNGTGSANGSRVFMSLPAAVTDWTFDCAPTLTDCPASFDLTALRSGQIINNWPAGDGLVITASGTAPPVVTGGNATLKFAALVTPGNGVPDANRANNAPPTAQTLVRSPQTCNYVVSPPSLSVGAATQSIQVGVLTGASCAWSVQNGVSWLNVSATGGTGNQVLVLTPQANTTAVSRSGTLSIAGQQISITQAGVPPAVLCSTLRLQREGDQMSATGVSGESAVAVYADSSCLWSSQAKVPWLIVTNGGAGAGNGSIKYVVQPNPTPDLRIGRIDIAEKSFTVTQQGATGTPNARGSDSGGDTSGGSSGGGDSGGSGGDSG